jgi:lipopolysaccharide transport system ATP-binding protein
MSDIVVQAENLGKSYIIGHERQRSYVALRDVFAAKAKEIARKTQQVFGGGAFIAGNEFEEFWALKDVNFEINHGDSVGIIGRNGAGKSTLLKVISRITEPSAGSVRIKGRVASLLEVGTGFHPELSGHENIYLNGAILGMGRKEIKSKLDEIVAFSGVERFLDTPVKRYSSGMYVRLAFAVAAHLDPEILVVDEVLAVGDSEFQKKCLGKMGDISKEGRTVLFISHNMAAIETLCSKAMIISAGKNSELGPPREIIHKYLQETTNNSNLPLSDRKDRRGLGKIQFLEISLIKENIASNVYSIGEDIYILLSIENNYTSSVNVSMALSVNTPVESLISCDSKLKGQVYELAGNSQSVLQCKISQPPLNLGNYEINIMILNGNEIEDWIVSAATFSIETGSFDNRISSNPFPVLAKFEWHLKK